MSRYKVGVSVCAPRGCTAGLSLGESEPELVAAGLGRLFSLGEIYWYGEVCLPPDLLVCPSQLIAKGGKVRAVHDRSNRRCG